MQIMDTNIALIEESAEFEWTYLNGYANVATIENIQKYFSEYCAQIKVIYKKKRDQVIIYIDFFSKFFVQYKVLLFTTS